MRALLCIAVSMLFAAAIGGCGGDDESKTVVVTQPASTPAPAEPTPAQTTPEPTPPAAGTSPTAAPPPTNTGGATAVQGVYKMVVDEESTLRGYSEDDELTWTALTRCAPKCVVELRRENTGGGFTNLTLEPEGATRYAADNTGTIDCLGEVPTRSRTSLSVLKQTAVRGVPVATQIQGFVRVRFTCDNGVDLREVLRLKGDLQQPPG